MTSEEALFEAYSEENGGCPDRLLIEDEGNTLLSIWKDTSYGKMVAKRFLKMYDCSDWRQNFMRNLKGKEGEGKTERYIHETSTSLLIGATFNICRFQPMPSRPIVTGDPE
jgi:hypothetical protein